MYLNSQADIQLMFRLNKVIMNFLPVISVHKFVNDVNFNLPYNVFHLLAILNGIRNKNKMTVSIVI